MNVRFSGVAQSQVAVKQALATLRIAEFGGCTILVHEERIINQLIQGEAHSQKPVMELSVVPSR